MRTMHPKVLSIVLSLPCACVLAPLLMNVPWLHYFMGYSLYSHYENVFLLTAISVYGLAQLVIFRLRHGYWRAVFHRVAFYVVSAEAVLVLGLVSLALLWVVPMALLLFSDSGREAWQPGARQVNI
ncbi:MAG TPA: hypothetical protein PKE57_08245 [Cellvibrionaceae bacterium]|nr:hypothetical protein [Cellvibrionaceae bacterium]HMW48495.1 hypothetical protein [Cellvibrionaceae bacterium]HMW70303.1 hypothetical protein [Cellvibrionaceae bacterium]HNG58360.1 hypothetical protein [Cellvibrionaceae bacterium]